MTPPSIETAADVEAWREQVAGRMRDFEDGAHMKSIAAEHDGVLNHTSSSFFYLCGLTVCVRGEPRPAPAGCTILFESMRVRVLSWPTNVASCFAFIAGPRERFRSLGVRVAVRSITGEPLERAPEITIWVVGEKAVG